jgi:hypothetical protein
VGWGVINVTELHVVLPLAMIFTLAEATHVPSRARLLSTTTQTTMHLSEGEVERNHVLSELSRVGSIYPRPSQGTS